MADTRVETVYSVTGYYDGPVSGIANFHNRPHAFERDDEADDGFDLFLVQPIDDETFEMAMEDWAIWTRWEKAFYSKQTSTETHPALPEDRPRHTQIDPILKSRLQIDPAKAVKAHGKFKVTSFDEIGGKRIAVKWQVEWLQNGET
jgi:hypothetical protein